MDEEEALYDDAEDRAEINADVNESYGAPTPEEKINQHTIIKQAIDSKDSLRVTYLTKGELGLPLFSTRFYLDCATICKMYNSNLLKSYFMDKIQNTSSSGMSNEGFMMKQNVTTGKNITRRHIRNEPLKEGENP
jgi:hypothetical protein